MFGLAVFGIAKGSLHIVKYLTFDNRVVYAFMDFPIFFRVGQTRFQLVRLGIGAEVDNIP